jgi:GNAT superfamily N-acetyltransferase
VGNDEARGHEASESRAEIEIRTAGPADAAAIAAVLFASFVEYEALYTAEGFAATALNEEQVRVRLRAGPVWLALRGAMVVGTVAGMIKECSAYMRGMAVLPEARGCRVGGRLVEQVEDWAAGEGCGRVFLSTTPFLSAAIRLYERLGFRRTEDGAHDLFGTPLFTMEKNISSTG